MTKKRGTDSTSGKTQAVGMNRRDFFKAGAAAGVGAAALGAPVAAPAAGHEAGPGGITWDYEVDVVICGGGCAGITAAIRARDAGVSVLVVDANYDLGGRMLHSGSFLSLGGGDVIQKREPHHQPLTSCPRFRRTAQPAQRPVE